MKVLVANKFHFLKGGAERYYFGLTRMLEERGHTVVPFAMQHELNERSEHEDLFVSPTAFDAGGRLPQRLRDAARVIYSVEARRRIGALVDRTSPDIAHLHNIAHQLSPSILYGLRQKGVPAVQTLHDYKLVCPNYQMFTRGRTCERCADWRYYNAVLLKCMRGSIASSAVVCAEAYVHKLLGSYARNVELFIAPSRWLRGRMIAHGVDPAKVVYVPNAISLGDFEPRYQSEGYAAYVGRLSVGKGLATLLRAAASVRAGALKVVGDGPLEGELRAYALRERLTQVEFLGYRTGEDLRSIMADASFVVVPSECYENAPLAVHEAAALGKAVVGSRIGGIPELVLDGETGLLYEPGDHEELAAKLEELWRAPDRAAEMGRAARRRAERELGADRHYESIMAIYKRVVQ